MSNTSVQKASWAKPVVQHIGTIGDVAAANLSSTNQVINDCGGKGGGTCKS